MVLAVELLQVRRFYITNGMNVMERLVGEKLIVVLGSGFLQAQEHYHVAKSVERGKPGEIANDGLVPKRLERREEEEGEGEVGRYPEDFVELRRDVYYKEDYFVLNKASWKMLKGW